MIVSGMKMMPVVIDRLNGMTFEQIAKKHKLNHGTQARAYYQNSLAHIVADSKFIQNVIRSAVHAYIKNSDSTPPNQP